MNDYGRLRASQLKEAAKPRRWLWEGYIAPGQITLLVSMWKSGKTTLMSHLLRERNRGGTLAGRAVAAGLSAVVSEEPVERWDERNDRLGFNPLDSFFCRPFTGAPTQSKWEEFLDFLAGLGKCEGVDLVIVDTLAFFLPMKGENLPRQVLDALTPLHKLTEAGVAVVLIHHPRKATAPQGMIARGSGVLPSFVDILMEIYPVRLDDSADRRRRIFGFSRDSATPRSLLIELNAEGTAYRELDAEVDDDYLATWETLRQALQEARHELTRREILKQWPEDFPRPNPATLWRWLKQAEKNGLIVRTGAGTSKDPFRYCLPEKLAEWQHDPLYILNQKMRESANLVLPPLTGYQMPSLGGG